MPQRNGQNPIKAGNRFERGGGSTSASANVKEKFNNIAGRCPNCKTEIPPKPGFRFSALKCPKCGTAMSKK